MARTSMYGDSPEDLRKVNLKTVRLGPTPMTTSVKFYTAWMAPNLSPTTLEVDARKLRYFAKFFEDLASRGVISSADPRRFEKSAIMEFMIWMKGKGLNPSTQDKYLQILGRWLKLFGNKVLEKMHKDATIKFPQADRERPIEALTREELQRVFDAAEGIPGEPGVRIRGFIAIAFTIGGRPKEVIRSHIEDINLEKRTFFVRHPKGEGTWGRSEEVPMLRRDMDDRIRKFLEERRKILEAKGVESNLTFYNPQTGKSYSDMSFRKLKKRVEEIAGVSFKLKEFRATLTSLTLDSHYERIPTMALQLRHKSPDTTRRYYARINKKKEIEEGLGDLWEESEIK